MPNGPTQLQADQSAIAQADILEAMDALRRGGVEWQVIMSGAFGAVANLIIQNVGQAEVPVIFARWAAATMHLSDG